jgi:hypothetical protein
VRVANGREPAVPLERRFRQVSKDLETDKAEAFRSLWSPSGATRWDDLIHRHRVVILADAGAGKTFELRAQAERMRAAGQRAFFLRIEDIGEEVTHALEIGSARDFREWLAGTEEAWLFLDSVDEARLDSPRTFEKALARLKYAIGGEHHRAHLFISSRPYAWRASADPALVERIFPFRSPGETSESDENELLVYWLAPLDSEAVRFYARFRGAQAVDGLIDAIERANLWAIAERPFDLEDILDKWDQDRALGTRLEMLRYGIDRRLKEIDPDRRERQPLNHQRALAGARLLAAAVTFMNMPGIRVSDTLGEEQGIDPEVLFPNWRPGEIQALLSRALFNDAIYGMVRFRHREVRELLAAEWLEDLLAKGLPRQAIESLIFREQYGERVITPRLRPLLPWLLVLDDRIRERALALDPAIAAEGGDPAQLPLRVRRRILAGITEQIARSAGTTRAGDNAAVARIAQADLSEDTARLIDLHGESDDVIFFLARVVWLGEMAACADRLVTVALDRSRDVYARIVSLRAAASLGGAQRRKELWASLVALDPPLDRRLLVELLDGAEADVASVDLLIATLPRLTPYERFGGTGLSAAIQSFIDRIPVGDATLPRLIAGLNALLEEQPHVDENCAVSEDHRWLIGPAVHGVERLVAARAPESLDAACLAILLKVPELRFWRTDDDVARKTALSQLVPAWPELNDALFWASVDERRTKLAAKDEKLTDDWPVSWIGHFWRFEADDFERLAAWIEERPRLDEKLVALGRAFRTYVQNDRPRAWMDRLQRAVKGNPPLEKALERYLRGPDPAVVRRQRAEDRKFQKEMERRERAEREGHERWVEELKANPERITKPDKIQPGEMTYDQWWLLQATYDDQVVSNRSDGANWSALIPEFGERVARTYREAAIAHWRNYCAPLRSEGGPENNTPGAVILGMAGLAIEAEETPGFPAALDEADMRRALRYVFWELNGFPSWFERFYRAFQQPTLQTIMSELEWELRNSPKNAPIHYLLHDLVFYAPWLHADLGPPITDWLGRNEAPHVTALRYCLHILIEGAVPSAKLAELARTKLQRNAEPDQRPQWFALWADSDPDAAIPALTKELAALEPLAASEMAQQFIVALTGGRNDRTPMRGAFMTPAHLGSLYALTHRYVRAAQDIERAGKGVYSPTLRDNAQDARNQLFNWLSEMPGKATYAAIARLAVDHPEPDYRKWMKLRARERAIADADLPPWSGEQMQEFAALAELTPVTHRQLFELLVLRLADLEDDLEGGNFSLAETLRRIPGETEMRNAIAALLLERSLGRYALAQEAELANAQRPDIWLQVPGAAPVPIEVKLLDQGWSGPKLRERLRNQLAGDYLRDRGASCGIMLLVWQGRQLERRWRIGGRSVDLEDLSQALAAYWQSIANQFPNAEDIRIVVIDLTTRARKSAT